MQHAATTASADRLDVMQWMTRTGYRGGIVDTGDLRLVIITLQPFDEGETMSNLAVSISNSYATTGNRERPEPPLALAHVHMPLCKFSFSLLTPIFISHIPGPKLTSPTMPPS